MLFKVVFETKGLEGYGVLGTLIEKCLGNELVNAHNTMAKITDKDGFYERANKKYDDFHKDENYIEFLNKEGMYILDKINGDKTISRNLIYEWDDEHQLLGRWKINKKVTIRFFLKKVETV